MKGALRSILGAFLAFLVVFSVPVHAQTTSASGFQSMMNGIIRGAPGVTTVAITDGVTSTAVGSVAVAAGGTTVGVPTTVAARVGASTIAKGAARVGLRIVPWVGTALVINDIVDAVGGSGLATCPPPDFFCKPQNIQGGTTTVKGDPRYRYCGGTSGCDIWESSIGAAQTDFCPAQVKWNIANGYTSVADCKIIKSDPAPTYTIYYEFYNSAGSYLSGGSRAASAKYICPDGKDSTSPDGMCTVTIPDQVKMMPAEEEDINVVLTRKANADHDWGVNMKKQLDAIAAVNEGLETPIDYKTVPVTITAPETAGPATVVSTKTIPNADGTTSTETVKQQVVVTPQIGSGGTMSDPQVTWPAKNVTTTTTVNNVTNVKNEVTNVTNIPAGAPEQKPLDIPTDYNREVTQKKILQQLDGSLVDVADPANQEDRTKAEVEKTDKSLADKFSALPGELAADKASWFSWVWTPPVGQCSASMFSGTVHGYSVNWDICDWVGRIRDALGWLFALFGAINIYSNLFRKENN